MLRTPTSSVLANKLLKERLAKQGYFELPVSLIETDQLRLLLYIFANQHLQAPTSSLVPQSLIMYLNMFQV